MRQLITHDPGDARLEGTRNVAARAGGWSARHRGKAFVGWLVLVVMAVIVGGSIGTEQIEDEDQSVGEAREADHAVADAFPDNADETVLIQSAGDGPTADQPAFRAVVDDIVAELEATENVVDVESPYFAGSEGAISRDGRSALVTLEIPDPGEDSDVTTEDLVEAPLAVVERLGEAHPGFRIEEFGDASANKQLSESFEDDFRRAEVTSLPITLLILLLAFAAVVAALVPLLLAATAVAAAIGLLGPLSQLWPVDDAATSVVLLVGLAVGVDYS
ncbi:MAG TPA: MMPL family transporter, partial [Solirubrobacterales bacterium]|nr:MMPL family transporter [Solirubrobacterales bacterium]